jgi:secondary thiamine-phosphate synthase enzyme
LIRQFTLEVATPGRGTTEVTNQLQDLVAESGIRTGLAHVFLHHTSASLLITENADPAVRRDLEKVLARLAPDGDPAFEHDAEGPDDMAAHVRAMLTDVDLSVPVTRGRLALGTWQGVYVYEHRHASHRRRLTLTVVGD